MAALRPMPTKSELRFRLIVSTLTDWHFRHCWLKHGPWCRLMEWAYWNIGTGTLLSDPR